MAWRWAFNRRSRWGVARVSLVSMAPDGETTGLRNALAIGAARAILVSDPVLSGSDALGTGEGPCRAMRRLEPDLVLAGTESTDGYTARRLSRSRSCWAGRQSASRSTSRSPMGLLRSTSNRSRLRRGHVPAPAVVTVTAGVVEPRYPRSKGSWLRSPNPSRK